MSPRPRILDELGSELVRAARAAEAAGARRRRRMPRVPRTPRAFVIGVLALLGLAAAAAAATLIVGRGEPIPAASSSDVPLELRPVAGSARLNGLAVPDPDGGPAWDVRTSRSRTGAVCATVGQVLDGELGLLGLDRRFRALPAGAADTCSAPQRTGATLAGARAFRGGGRLRALTVVNGVAAPTVRRAVAVAGRRTVAMRVGPGRAFLAVFQGLPEELRPRVVLTEASGRRTTLRFADSGEFIAADPSGGTPWALEYKSGAKDLRCVEARRERGPDSPLPSPQGTFDFNPPSTTARCGPRGRGIVAIRRYVPDAKRVGTYQWGLNPARTVVWGLAPRGASAVVLTGAGAARRLAVDRRHGGFLAVLDGHVDPRRLGVSAGGAPLDERAAVGRSGQALAPAAVAPWRSVASNARAIRVPDSSYDPAPTSVAIARRADDPTGGPHWALRSWSSHIGGRVGAGVERDVRCIAVGLERGKRLVEPLAGGTYRTVGTAEGDGYCLGPRWLTEHAGPVFVRTYVGDPDATVPRPAFLVVFGILGDGASSAQLLGAGDPRPLDLGPHGEFLVVLGPEHAGVALRVRQVRADGRARTSRDGYVSTQCRPSPNTSASRIADPDGGQPWTSGVGTIVGGPRALGERGDCLYHGRLIGDRLGSIVDGQTWVRYGADGFAGGTGRAVGPHRALVLDVQGPGFLPSREPVGPPSPAQVARRTLPGRTLVMGRASSAVTSITLRTPRDVRTVRPAVGGAFLAVYDGPFYGGLVRATAHLRDGRSVTVTRPVAPP